MDSQTAFNIVLSLVAFLGGWVLNSLRDSIADIGKYEGSIKACVKVPLYQRDYDAYTSLSYNIGTGAFCGSTLVKKLNTGNYTLFMVFGLPPKGAHTISQRLAIYRAKETGIKQQVAIVLCDLLSELDPTGAHC